MNGDIESKEAFIRVRKEVKLESSAGYEFKYDKEWRVPIIKIHTLKIGKEEGGIRRKGISTTEYIEPGEPAYIW